ncbi:MAG: hypothetical protein WCK51_01620 [Armatimonadota bacterium]
MIEGDLIHVNEMLRDRIARLERKREQRKFSEEFMRLSMERMQLQVGEIMKKPNENMIASAKRLEESRESSLGLLAKQLARYDADLVAVKSRTEALRSWRNTLER